MHNQDLVEFHGFDINHVVKKIARCRSVVNIFKSNELAQRWSVVSHKVGHVHSNEDFDRHRCFGYRVMLH
jgi:hypothetical protein